MLLTIRDVESNILDRHYREQPLLRRPQRQAVAQLLKVYGDLHRDLSAENRTRGHDEMTVSTVLRGVTMGLEHSLRWVLKECPPGGRLQPERWQELDNEAMLLLLWGKTYSELASMHTAWSRQVVDARIDTQEQEIVFSLRQKADLGLFLSQALSEISWSDGAFGRMPADKILPIFIEWSRSIDVRELAKRDFSTPDIPPSVMDAVVAWVQEAMFAGVEDTASLGDFTLGDFRRFYAGLWAHATCVAMLEQRTDEVHGLANDLGSLIIHDSPETVVAFASAVSGLVPRVTRRIISLITFDATSFHSSISSQPFVRTKCQSLSLSMRLFAQADPHRLLAGAMIKTRSRLDYEHMIEAMERRGVEDIANQFRRAGFLVMVGRSLSRGGIRICPDIIVIEASTNLALALEYKHALPPVGPAEVSNKIKEYEKWAKQATRYKDFLSRPDQSLHHSLLPGTTGLLFDVALLFRWPIPIPTRSTPGIIVGDAESLGRIIDARGQGGLATIIGKLRAAMTQPSIDSPRWRSVNVRTRVAGWTYVRPIFGDVIGEPSEPLNWGEREW